MQLMEVIRVMVLIVSLSESVSGVSIFLGLSKGKALSSQFSTRPLRSFLSVAPVKIKLKPSKQHPFEEEVGMGDSLIRWMAVTSS